jgi:hypothetical protein
LLVRKALESKELQLPEDVDEAQGQVRGLGLLLGCLLFGCMLAGSKKLHQLLVIVLAVVKQRAAAAPIIWLWHRAQHGSRSSLGLLGCLVFVWLLLGCKKLPEDVAAAQGKVIGYFPHAAWYSST